MVNKGWEKGSATVWLEHAAAKKTLRLVNEKLSKEEAAAWKNQEATRKALRFVNNGGTTKKARWPRGKGAVAWRDQEATRTQVVDNGGAPFRHLANPPEVTPEV